MIAFDTILVRIRCPHPLEQGDYWPALVWKNLLNGHGCGLVGFGNTWEIAFSGYCHLPFKVCDDSAPPPRNLIFDLLLSSALVISIIQHFPELLLHST
jgi:hypothetical protein